MTVAGSHLYGTNVETSDYDFKGVCIPTKDYFFGYLKVFEQLERKAGAGAPADLVVMSLAKFCRLAVDCNPNIIELLFAPEECITHVTGTGLQLLDAREMFVSKKARHTFAGYAHSQLRRIKTHRAWLLNPPTQPPTRKEFGLSETHKASKAELGAFNALEEEGKTDDMPKEMLTLFLRERQYQGAMTTWKQYENWKATRNEARAGLEAKYGYDTKHAMHLIRLMRMCREILTDGSVIVRRPDREELLAIRNGEWSYEKLIEQAERIDEECEGLYATSPLKKEPDRKAIDELVVKLTYEYLFG